MTFVTSHGAEEFHNPLTSKEHMPISENDISVIIPTFRYRDRVVHAVRSAIDSGAGEIIVIDDFSKDGTIEILSQFDDPRLTVVENSSNLGLWENHLAGLSLATRPWIKFLQADDYLTTGGLAAFAGAADENVSIVWSCPVMHEQSTGEQTVKTHITKPYRFTSNLLFDLCRKVGWILGRPSDVLIRADCIERAPESWITEISADFVHGIIAATRGDIVMLPAGNVVNVDHDAQDTRTQGPGRGFIRMLETVKYLDRRRETEIVHFAAEWAALNLKVATRNAIAAVYFGQISLLQASDMLRRYFLMALKALPRPQSRASVRSALCYRVTSKGMTNIDVLMAQTSH
jgi:glycosyltransferase involved in cell wall biosynthesis